MTTVIKLGGRAQSDAGLPASIAGAWKNAGGKLCVVHGGGDEITALQVALGKKPTFVKGRRVTTPDDIQLLRMVLSGVINKRLVSAFGKSGIPALGLSGEDGKIIAARRPRPDEEMFELGSVGMPEAVNAKLLRAVMKEGYLPVISPVAGDGSASETGALNVNGDDAAAAIAVALAASELLFVADVTGVMSDGGLIDSIDLGDVEELVRNGTVRGGMTAKLDAARTALEGGVTRVRISDLGGIMDQKRGTTVTALAGHAK